MFCGYLKQLTGAQTVTIQLGPFLDSIDGDTEENSLTIAAAAVLVSKNGGNFAAKSETTALTGTGANGHYDCKLNATDVGTLGILDVQCHPSGALFVKQSYMVVPANVWDSLFGADRLQVHAAEITAGLITAAAIAAGAITGAKFDGSTAFPLTSADTGSTRVARTGADGDTLEDLSDQLDGVPSRGSGSVETVITLTEDGLVGGTPVADADVWVATDSAGSNIVAGTLQSNAQGQVTVYLDPGTYYVFAQKDGWNGLTGSTLTVT